MTIRTTLTACLAAACTVAGMGQSRKWTLADCIDYALQHNVTLQKNRAATTTAGISLAEAKAGRLPSLGASVQQNLQYLPFQETAAQYVNGGMTSTSANKVIQGGSYGVSASWTVWNGRQTALGIQSAEAAARTAGLAEETTALTLQENIVQHYVQILYLTEALRVNRELMQSDSILYERGRELLTQEQISRADLAQLEAQLAAARYSIVDAGTQVVRMKTNLMQALEFGPGDDIEIADENATAGQIAAPLPDKQVVYAAALQNRPEIKSGELAVTQSLLQTKIAKAARQPSISLQAGLGNSHMTGGSRTFSDQMKHNFNTNLGLGISIPIFDNRQTKSRIERAQVAELTAQLDLVDARKQLWQTIENHYLDAVNSRARYESACATLESRQSSYDMLSEQFTLGLINIAELQAGRQNLMTAKQDVLQNKYTAMLNRTLLNLYLNGEIQL
ncbi:MAG: TolC family protein [Prevotellaceae bacterium]|nr:TolC family protein [Prevotellaceae bacterium]